LALRDGRHFDDQPSLQRTTICKFPSLRLSQGEVAAMLGLSREWVSRELVKWRDEGIIDLGRKRIVIRDRPALERIFAQGRSEANGIDQ
jgi:CRP-like cAMP-binding protein